MDAAIVAEGLTKRYGAGRSLRGRKRRPAGGGAVEAVKGITFTVPRGVTYGFLGPNGAGKTTTIRMLTGLSPVTSGRLDVLGLPMSTRSREVKAQLGVVPQESNLDADMTCRENLVTHARFYDILGPQAEEKSDELLSFMQLTEKRDEVVSRLSGGMKRRLLIARALINDPELLVLDEPTTGLDPQSRQLVWEKVRALQEAGKTILLTTHYMEEAERLCQELVVIDHGRIIAQGKPKALIRAHVGREVLEIELPPADQTALLAKLGPVGHDAVGDVLHLYAEDAEKLLDEVQDLGFRPTQALFRRAALEDVFLKITGRRLEA